MVTPGKYAIGVSLFVTLSNGVDGWTLGPGVAQSGLPSTLSLMVAAKPPTAVEVTPDRISVEECVEAVWVKGSGALMADAARGVTGVCSTKNARLPFGQRLTDLQAVASTLLSAGCAAARCTRHRAARPPASSALD